MSREVRASRGRERHEEGPTRVGLLLCLIAGLAVALMAAAAVAMAGERPSLAAPMELPGASASAAGGSGSANGRWLVGATPGAESEEVVASAGARAVSEAAGIYSVPIGGARRLARMLKARELLEYAEPDVASRRGAYPTEPPPYSYVPEEWWLDAIASPQWTTPPPVLSSSPELAIVESSIDISHPEFQGSSLTGAVSISPQSDEHGTAIASIAGAPANGNGIVGVWPGMRMRLFPKGGTCSTATSAVYEAVDSGVSVLNMSYYFPAEECFSHFMATQYAVSRGVVPVASAGNNFTEGNQPLRPASDPHVVTVAAVEDPTFESGQTYQGVNESNLRVAAFSNRSDGNDVSAPGVRVVAAVPTATATSGYAYMSGTSFAAPMVAAASTWLRQERPALSVDQVASVLNRSAVDLGPAGHDQSYGWGLLDIDSALKRPAPRRDPLEPNDDIEWVDGSRLRSPSPFLLKRSKSKKKKDRKRSVSAQVSSLEDPADVYRLRLLPRQRVAVTVAQQRGDVLLEALQPRATSIYDLGSARIVKVDRPPKKKEAVRIRNLSGAAKVVYLAVAPSPRNAQEGAAYRLTVAEISSKQ